MDDIPSSSEMLEELVTNAETEIIRNHVKAFETAFEELLSFHAFLINAYLSETKGNDEKFSLAQMGYWQPLHVEWRRQYGRLFEAGVAQLSSSDEYLRSLMYASYRLFQSTRKDGGADNSVSRAMLDMNNVLIHRLEDWAVENDLQYWPSAATGGAELKLKNRYDQIILHFIGANRNLLQAIPIEDGWMENENNAAAEWQTYKDSWPLLWASLRNTLYILVVAVWHNDETAAIKYADAVLDWIDPIKYRLESKEYVLDRAYISADCLGLEWSKITEKVKAYLQNPEWDSDIKPNNMLDALLRNAQEDVLILASCVMADWLLRGAASSSLPFKIYKELLSRSFKDEDERPFFSRMVLAFFRVQVIANRFSDKGYAAGLDEVVSMSDGLSEETRVPGKVYFSTTMRDRGELLDPFSLLLLQFMPPDLSKEGEDKIITAILGGLDKEAKLPNADDSLRDVLRQIKSLVDCVSESDLVKKERAYSLAATGVAIEVAASNLRAMLEKISNGLNENRNERLVNRQIDPEKIASINMQISKTAFIKENAGFPVYLFRDVERDESIEADKFLRLTNYSKGLLVSPAMEQRAVNEEEYLTEIMQTRIASEALRQVWKNSKIDETFVEGADQYWATIKSFIAKEGPCVLLVSGYGDPVWLYEWKRSRYVTPKYPIPADLKIWTATENKKSQDDYLFHLNDTPVYRGPIERGVSYLFPLGTFDRIKFKSFSDGNLVQVKFEPNSEEVWMGALVFTYGMVVESLNTNILEIKIKGDLEKDPDTE